MSSGILQVFVELGNHPDVPESDKHLKKAGGHVGRNLMEITIKMKTIVRKTLMIKINKLRLRNLDNWNKQIELNEQYNVLYSGSYHVISGIAEV